MQTLIVERDTLSSLPCGRIAYETDDLLDSLIFEVHFSHGHVRSLLTSKMQPLCLSNRQEIRVLILFPQEQIELNCRVLQGGCVALFPNEITEKILYHLKNNDETHLVVDGRQLNLIPDAQFASCTKKFSGKISFWDTVLEKGEFR